ncbi:putative porin, partial [Eudoraea sp.]|uniref:putative porin n=1 Tax=Eudoraea sp. TaxID=1979955 RepID=UPI003C72979B
MKFKLLFLFFICSLGLYSQVDSIPAVAQDSLQKRIKKAGKKKETDSVAITIEDYKIISYARDTTYLDTTLSIQKEYKYNYLRKDNFELMPFSNVGQPYNSLGHEYDRTSLYPAIGATAKHFNYQETQDIAYYNVATPMTDLFFKTTFEQGQLLDAMLTFNTSRRFNVSIAYKGFRSLGKYQWSQVKSGNFRTTLNYVTENGRYRIRAHWTSQEIEGEENGGISNKELQFESKDPEFSDRSRIDDFFTDAQNKLIGKRYYLDHQYRLFNKKSDSLSFIDNYLALGHVFTYESKNYQFGQTNENPYFGEAFLTPISDRANLKTMYNEINAEFSNKTLGVLKGLVGLYNYNYFFNSIVINDTGEIPNKLQGDEIALGARYTKKIGGFELDGGISYALTGSLTGNIFDATASFRINPRNVL